MAKSGIGGRENRLISGVGIAVLCLVATTLILAVVPQNDPRVSAVRQVFLMLSPRPSNCSVSRPTHLPMLVIISTTSIR